MITRQRFSLAYLTLTVTIPVQVSTLPEYAEKGSQPIEFTFTYRETDAADAEPTVLKLIDPALLDFSSIFH